MKSRELNIENYQVKEKPFYVEIKDEVELFKAAFRSKIPVLLKGPTGTGKPRFIEYMVYTLGLSIPLITVACHEDLTFHLLAP